MFSSMRKNIDYTHLDIKDQNLVKEIYFEGLRVLGKPEHFARHYCENDANLSKPYNYLQLFRIQ